jgi:U4/U6.U5 tri-snRNP-associated protein 1
MYQLTPSILGDLVGLKVSHDFDEMDEGEARILTLKDSRILDDEGNIIVFSSRSYTYEENISEDELQNVEMAEDERTEKNNELKLKKRDYTGYDDDEFRDGTQGMKRAVLAKYDEDIEGTRETVSSFVLSFTSRAITRYLQGFRLGSSVVSAQVKQQEQKQQVAASVNKLLLSIDYASQFELRS